MWPLPPEGTAVTIVVRLDELTVAATVPNFTVFELGVLLKPSPYIVTDIPTGPLFGVKPKIETVEEVVFVISSRLPALS